MQINEDASNNTMTLIREYDADPETIWKAYTTSEMLDQWWAPRPWKAETKSMDFREGGSWIYAMVGPGGEKHWAKTAFSNIKAPASYNARDMFTDEQGNPQTGMPQMNWQMEFAKSGSGTKVTTRIKFTSEEDRKKVVDMGFKEGISMAADNLDELLETE